MTALKINFIGEEERQFFCLSNVTHFISFKNSDEDTSCRDKRTKKCVDVKLLLQKKSGVTEVSMEALLVQVIPLYSLCFFKHILYL